MCLTFAACSNDNDVVVNNEAQAPITVQVEGFAVSQEDMPSTCATAVGSYTNVKALTLAFYKSDGTESYKHTQLQDNFVATQAVNINNSNAVNLTATLDRVVSRLGVVSTDSRAADAAKIRMSFSGGGCDFNPTTGLATTNTGFANTLTFVEAVGTTVMSASYLFLGSDEQTMNVTIETLDASDNVLFARQLTMCRSSATARPSLTGNVFTADSNVSSITINSDWLDSHNVGF